MVRVKLDEIVAAGSVSFVYCQRDEKNDFDDYRALCKCGVDSGWVSFDSQAVRDCAYPVRFVAGTLRAALTEKGCRCSAVSVIYFPPADSLPPGPDLTRVEIHMAMAGGHCGSATCTTCDPMERMVDGLTVRECLDLWVDNQRTYDLYGRGGGYAPLTAAQKSAASLAWSSSLRAKQAEVKERERLSVRCDEQWGEDV